MKKNAKELIVGTALFGALFVGATALATSSVGFNSKEAWTVEDRVSAAAAMEPGNPDDPDVYTTDLDLSEDSTTPITTPGRYIATNVTIVRDFEDVTGSVVNIDVGAGNLVELELNNINIHYDRYVGTSGSYEPMINVVSGDVVIKFSGNNSFEGHQDSAGGYGGASACSVIKLSSSSTLTLEGTGSLAMFGGSNYNGGAAAIEGGKELIVNSGNVTLRGGNKVQNDYGEAFGGNTISINGGTLTVEAGKTDNSTSGSLLNKTINVASGASLDCDIIDSDNKGITNAGTISCDNFAVGGAADFNNTGTIKGSVYIGEGAELWNSNSGVIEGEVTAYGTLQNRNSVTGDIAVQATGTLNSTGSIKGNVTALDKNSTIVISDGEITKTLTIANQGTATLYRCTIDKVSGANGRILIGDAGVVIDELIIDNIDRTNVPDDSGDVPTLKVVTTYTYNGAEVPNCLVNDKVILSVNASTMLTGKYYVLFNDKFYVGTANGDTIEDKSGFGIEWELDDATYDVPDNLTSSISVGEEFTAIFKAKEGYYFPSNFGESVIKEDGGSIPSYQTNESIVYSVSEDNTEFTVSYTFNDSKSYIVDDLRTYLAFTIPAATAKTTQAAPKVSGGLLKILDTTTAMEYRTKNSDEDWIGCSKTETTVEKGQYEVRYAETNTKLASSVTYVTVKGSRLVKIENNSEETHFIWDKTTGNETQRVGDDEEIKPVTYYVEEGYIVPEDYSIPEASGIEAKRLSDKAIEISGTPTSSSVTITIAEAEKKPEEPEEVTWKVSIVNPEDSHLIWKGASGAESQDCSEKKAFEAVLYVAEDGYYIPEEYAIDTPDEINVTRVDMHTLKVWGEPTKEAEVTLMAIKTKSGVLEVPEEFYTLSGTMGKNDYYTSNVSVVAKEGYLLSLNQNYGYYNSLGFESTTDDFDVYVSEIATGFTSQAVKVKGFKIDSVAPVITGVEEGALVYGEKLVINVADTNLAKVKVNDELVEVKDGKAVAIVSSDDNKLEFEISAEDIAGNITSIKATVVAPWMETMIVPAGKTLLLEKNIKYTLGAGQWTVNGDSTVYNGGQNFYCPVDSSYTFMLKGE